MAPMGGSGLHEIMMGYSPLSLPLHSRLGPHVGNTGASTCIGLRLLAWRKLAGQAPMDSLRRRMEYREQHGPMPAHQLPGTTSSGGHMTFDPTTTYP